MTQYIDRKCDWPCKMCRVRGHLPIFRPQGEETCLVCRITGHRSSNLQKCNAYALGGRAILHCINCDDEHATNDRNCPKAKEWKENQRRLCIGKGSQQGKEVRTNERVREDVRAPNLQVDEIDKTGPKKDTKDGGANTPPEGSSNTEYTQHQPRGSYADRTRGPRGMSNTRRGRASFSQGEGQRQQDHNPQTPNIRTSTVKQQRPN